VLRTPDLNIAVENVNQIYIFQGVCCVRIVNSSLQYISLMKLLTILLGWGPWRIFETNWIKFVEKWIEDLKFLFKKYFSPKHLILLPWFFYYGSDARFDIAECFRTELLSYYISYHWVTPTTEPPHILPLNYSIFYHWAATYCTTKLQHILPLSYRIFYPWTTTYSTTELTPNSTNELQYTVF
jgi:hypothetical protein